MKNLYALVLILSFFCPLTGSIVSAQTSLGINYQAVARDVAGAPLATQTITVDFVIHRGSAVGPSSWNESFSPVTNQFGLFNLVIGSTVPANFDTIGWGKTSYWLEVFVNTISMGTTKFQSVPYAKNAATAGNGLPPGASGQTLRNNGTNWVSTSNLYNDGANVGIGTASPSSPLELQSANGTVEFLSGATFPILLLPTGGGGKYIQLSHSAGIDAVFGSNGSAALVGTSTNHHLDFMTNGANVMRLMNNGSVGIGNTFPNISSLVEITSTTKGILIPRMTSAQRIAIGTPATGLLVYDNTDNSFYYYNGTIWTQISSGGTITGTGTTNYVPKWTGANSLSSTSLIYDDGANVGIGTASPQGTLHVYDPAVNGTPEILAENGNSTGVVEIILKTNGGAFDHLEIMKGGSTASGSIDGINLTNLSAISAGANAGPLMLRTVTNNPIYFLSNNLKRMIIDGSGNVGIGTTSPGVRLEVNSPGVTSSFRVRDAAGVWIEMSRSKIIQRGATFDIEAWEGDIIFRTTSSSTERVRIENATGNIGIGGISPTEKLDVAGKTKTTNFQMTNGATAAGMVLTTLDVSGNAAWQTPPGGLSGGTNNYITKWSSPTSITSSKLFDNGTNVGIGTASPTNRLHVVDNEIPANAADDDADGKTDEVNDVLVFNTNGNVGIGTTTPTFPLFVETFTLGRAGYFSNLGTGGASKLGITAGAYGTGAGNRTGAQFDAAGGSSTNIGVIGFAQDGTTNYGLQGIASGVATTNIGGQFSASGATNNYAIIVPPTGGSVGIGTTTPPANAKLAIRDGHIQTSQPTPPAIAPTANAGTGAVAIFSAGINANDITGQISLTTGSAAWASGSQCNITFNKSYAAAPLVILTPANQVTASAMNSRQWYVSSTLTTFSINFGIAAIAALTYQWNYMIIEP